MTCRVQRVESRERSYRLTTATTTTDNKKALGYIVSPIFSSFTFATSCLLIIVFSMRRILLPTCSSFVSLLGIFCLIVWLGDRHNNRRDHRYHAFYENGREEERHDHHFSDVASSSSSLSMSRILRSSKQQQQYGKQKHSHGVNKSNKKSNNHHKHKNSSNPHNGKVRRNHTHGGSSTAGITPYIVGGSSAQPGQFPFFASITSSSNYLCGASLIAPDLLLTAGHCQDAFQHGAIVGVTSLATVDAGAVAVTVVEQVINPNFFRFLTDDLMILKISPSVQTIPPVTMNFNASYPTTNESLTILGFGKTSDTSGPSQTLQVAQVYPVPTATCQTYYAGNLIIDPLKHICVWNKKSSTFQGACEGDSGGPLLNTPSTAATMSDATARMTYGVLSFGQLQCTQGPAVYTRLTSYFSWLQQVICNTSDVPPTYMYCDQLTARNATAINSNNNKSYSPTKRPTLSPTTNPTSGPTTVPTSRPSPIKTSSPTTSPTLSTTADPSSRPTSMKTSSPTTSPTLSTTADPTSHPTPTISPTSSATAVPSSFPTPMNSNSLQPKPTYAHPTSNLTQIKSGSLDHNTTVSNHTTSHNQTDNLVPHNMSDSTTGNRSKATNGNLTWYNSSSSTVTAGSMAPTPKPTHKSNSFESINSTSGIHNNTQTNTSIDNFSQASSSNSTAENESNTNSTTSGGHVTATSGSNSTSSNLNPQSTGNGAQKGSNETQSGNSTDAASSLGNSTENNADLKFGSNATVPTNMSGNTATEGRNETAARSSNATLSGNSTENNTEKSNKGSADNSTSIFYNITEPNPQDRGSPTAFPTGSEISKNITDNKNMHGNETADATDFTNSTNNTAVDSRNSTSSNSSAGSNAGDGSSSRKINTTILTNIPSTTPHIISNPPTDYPSVVPSKSPLKPPSMSPCQRVKLQYQTCLTQNMTTFAVNGCLTCLNKYIPTSPKSCTDYQNAVCDAPSRCGCDPCNDSIAAYIRCASGCGKSLKCP